MNHFNLSFDLRVGMKYGEQPTKAVALKRILERLVYNSNNDICDYNDNDAFLDIVTLFDIARTCLYGEKKWLIKVEREFAEDSFDFIFSSDNKPSVEKLIPWIEHHHYVDLTKEEYEIDITEVVAENELEQFEEK